MKNIFLISREYPPSTSGASIAMDSYIKPLKSCKFFITSYWKPEKTDERFMVKKIKHRFKPFRYISAAHFIIQSVLNSPRDSDCIIGNALVGSFCGAIVKVFRRKPFISMVYDVDSLQKGVSSFGPITRFIRTLVYKFIFKNSDVSVVSTLKVKKDIIDIFGKNIGKKIDVLPIGVETEPFKKIKKPKDKKIVLTAGGIMQKRGLEYLIEGLKDTTKKVRNVELWIVGAIIDKEYYEKIKTLVKTLGLEKNVRFIGWVPHSSKRSLNIFSYYDICDVFVVSCYHSMGYSLTCIEASLMGKPIVTTDIIKDLGVVNNKTALIVPIKDSASMGKAITKLLENSKLRKKMGEAGKEHGKNFNILEISKKYEAIIQDTIKRNETN